MSPETPGSSPSLPTSGSPTSPRGVGVIGLGVMGQPMAGHMVSAGLDVHVYARRPGVTAALVEAGATAHLTAADLGAQCGVVIFVVPDLPDVEAILRGPDGLLVAVDHPLVLVINSTVSPEGVRELGTRLAAETGSLVHVVDAPISGGERGAVAATLAIMVGGSTQDVATVTPALRACGNPVHLGPLGAGQVAKACNQMIVAATVLALGEASVVAERAGLDVGALLDLLGTGLAGSQVLEQKKHAFMTHDHRPSGPARFMVKDLTFATDEARRSGTATPQLDVLRAVFTDLVDSGLGDQDTAVVQAYIEKLTVR